MMTRNYETVFIASPALADARINEIKEKSRQVIEAHSGKVLNVDDWGKRRMSYPINKEFKGHYVCFTYSGDNGCVAELERNMRINEDIIRFLTIKIDEKVDPMTAIQEYKKRLEAHAKREKERAERDAEKMAAMGDRRGGGRGFGGRRPFREEAEVSDTGREEASGSAPVETEEEE